MKEDLSEFEIKPPYDPPEMKATLEELQAAQIPREYRDFCAHLLIPLNQCRCGLSVAFVCFVVVPAPESQAGEVSRNECLHGQTGSVQNNVNVAGEKISISPGSVRLRSTSTSCASMQTTRGAC
jgi:NADH-ubiquinone oxidoreductase B18 subunit (NDUFB7)